MWRLDKDPYLSSTVGNITVLDRRADYERFKRRLERASRLVPRLRQRVQPTPVSLTPPVWVDDPVPVRLSQFRWHQDLILPQHRS